jgi:hypothetical protein
MTMEIDDDAKRVCTQEKNGEWRTAVSATTLDHAMGLISLALYRQVNGIGKPGQPYASPAMILENVEINLAKYEP